MPEFLGNLCQQAADSGLSVQICPVDDGSGKQEADRMRDLVSRLQPQYPFLLNAVCLDKNAGKGGAIYAGWDAAGENNFQWLAFVDADGAVSPEETIRVITETVSLPTEKKNCTWAVRVHSEETRIKRTLLRKVLGNVFRLLVRFTFHLPVRDTQCGLKCIPSEAYWKVREHLIEKRFVFDVELCAQLVRAGYTIRENPISWNESSGSTLNMKSAFRMLTSLIGVRWRMFRQPRKA
ncbi:MAG: glycosyltransferase [Verrucomicrobiales bacterium]|nr:glycosyltransferase [Verrucomicrobiales bacterium]